MEQKRRIESVNNKLKSIKVILEELNKIAESDGKVTDEEVQIINSINYHFDNYQALIEDALQDKVLTDEEMQTLFGYEKRIVHAASSAAFTDGVISKDERNLLDSLIKYFEEIQKL